MMRSKLAQSVTAEEFSRMAESRYAELVRGEVVETPVNNWTHGDFLTRLAMLLGSFVIPRGLGRVYTGDPGMVLDHDNVRGPDLAFVSAERVNLVPAEGFWSEVADLVVEIVSPGDVPAEVEDKVGQYLSAGVRLVWVVSPMTEQVAEYGAGAHLVLDGSDVLDGREVLRGFRNPVADLFDARKTLLYPI